MTLEAIGVVRCEVRERKQMPTLGVPARLELFPRFTPGLLRIQKHSHIWVFGWFDRAGRDVLQVTPKGVSDRGPEGLHGVFAVRSPVRPNPIGMTAANVLRVAGQTIEVDRLDFLDGTPLVDIKPYFVSRDLIFSATNEQIGQPADRDAMRDSLLFQAVHFHGELCSGVALGVRLVEHFRAEVLGMAELAGWQITAPLERPCLVDALMGIARVAPGRGTLRFAAGDLVRFERGSQIATYHLLADPAAGAERILASQDSELFRPA